MSSQQYTTYRQEPRSRLESKQINVAVTRPVTTLQTQPVTRIEPVSRSVSGKYIRNEPVIHPVTVTETRIEPVVHPATITETRVEPVVHPVVGTYTRNEPVVHTSPVPYTAYEPVIHSVSGSVTRNEPVVHQRPGTYIRNEPVVHQRPGTYTRVEPVIHPYQGIVTSNEPVTRNEQIPVTLNVTSLEPQTINELVTSTDTVPYTTTVTTNTVRGDPISTVETRQPAPSTVRPVTSSVVTNQITSSTTIPVANINIVKPNARVRFIHNVTGGPLININIDGKLAHAGMGYPTVTNYTPLDVGNNQVVITDNNNQVTLLNFVLSLQAKDYTVIIDGSVINKSRPIRAILLDDDNTCPAAGRTKVRVVHAAADLPTVNVYVDGQKTFSDLSYGEISRPTYVTIAGGIHSITINVSGSNARALGPVNVRLDPSKIYTIIASGRANDARYPPSLLVEQDNYGKCYL